MPLPTLMELITRSGNYLKEKGIANGRREAEWIFAETLKLSRLDLYTRFDMPLDEPEVAALRALVQRRGKREPLAYVLGTQDFCGVVLTVSPAVLVPRPETEELVERILADTTDANARVLDVGTGSGAIAIALKHARPAWTVEATDVDAAALTVARNNSERLHVPVLFHHGHLAQSITGPFAVVVANLPYIGASERQQCDPELAYEPQHALFAEDEGLHLMSELIADARRIINKENGVLWLEHGWQQGETLRALGARHELEVDILADAQGKDRFARITVR